MLGPTYATVRVGTPTWPPVGTPSWPRTPPLTELLSSPDRVGPNDEVGQTGPQFGAHRPLDHGRYQYQTPRRPPTIWSLIRCRISSGPMWS